VKRHWFFAPSYVISVDKMMCFQVKRNSTKFVPIDSDWTTELKTTSREPLDYFELHGLEPETEYQLRMRVCNELGCSNYSSSDFVFHTPERMYEVVFFYYCKLMFNHSLESDE